MSLSRRRFLALSAAALAAGSFPPVIRKALAIPAARRTGTLEDVEHVVFLMQENRAFDHYFGTMAGVRGFGDRFTIPLPNGRSVWEQRLASGQTIRPFHLDGATGNAQRVGGTPHTWFDAQLAWANGAMEHWPQHKLPRSMGYYTEDELTFHFALARAFTICDAYHCSVHGGTNPNRLFMFTGTNDPAGTGGGPAIDNTNDDLGPPAAGYGWTTYPERLEAAGVSWKVYQDLADNFTDNSLAGFRAYRHAFFDDPASPLARKGVATTLVAPNVDELRADVTSGRLPQVSWIVAPARYSEHPDPSSPVQGAWYTAQVLDALTTDPDVWSRTVLFVMFDENDGFFDHVPPPAAPSFLRPGVLAGKSTLDDATERHPSGLVYGPGPRVPMWVVSPWSRGGWVDSECFDHTSLVRFVERRFGVAEPNISPWRRAMLGDLTSAFDFRRPSRDLVPFLRPPTKEDADALRTEQETLPQIAVPVDDAGASPPQARGVRPSRALPYELSVDADVRLRAVRLVFGNTGTAGAVLHVYDRRELDAGPRRYAVEAGKAIDDVWEAEASGAYDLWVLGPNGFVRHFEGTTDDTGAEIDVRALAPSGALKVRFHNRGIEDAVFVVTANAYRTATPKRVRVRAGRSTAKTIRLASSKRWYDFTVTVDGRAALRRRLAGRVENGRPSVTDPALA